MLIELPKPPTEMHLNAGRLHQKDHYKKEQKEGFAKTALGKVSATTSFAVAIEGDSAKFALTISEARELSDALKTFARMAEEYMYIQTNHTLPKVTRNENGSLVVSVKSGISKHFDHTGALRLVKKRTREMECRSCHERSLEGYESIANRGGCGKSAVHLCAKCVNRLLAQSEGRELRVVKVEK
jgi:hypothetical protein